MGENLKISKDKRHRSSSSIAGPVLEGTRSERRLGIRGSILEVDDQFALAEARCEDLQDKIDLVKGLKRKRKLRKRSMTRLPEQQHAEEAPYISIRTQPKKRIEVQQAARIRRHVAPANPVHAYVDPANVEQHRMLRQVLGYNQTNRSNAQEINIGESRIPRNRVRSRADGDMSGAVPRGMRVPALAAEVACGDDGVFDPPPRVQRGDARRPGEITSPTKNNVPKLDTQKQAKQVANRRRHVPRDVPLKEEGDFEHPLPPWRAGLRQPRRPRHPSATRHAESVFGQRADGGERPVVELFHKNRSVHSVDLTRCNSREQENFNDDTAYETAAKEKVWRQNRRVKYRSRGYEMPTLASQMKQANAQFFRQTTSNAIPFIVSKSTAPSHNIGVNIQQVLNGLKTQQPLNCIPLTIAHHMGLGHIPSYETKRMQPSLDNREINAIRLGKRLLRLPSYKYVSYNRLLNLYRECDGVVSRFLRSIDRPNQFYTSMYNLATRDDGDSGAATLKSRAMNQEAKLSLAEYASLYQEYQQVDKRLKESYDPELERRRDELARHLADREDYIRKVVQEYRSSADADGLRASASIAEDTYRMSNIKLHGGDLQ
ncbi:hypothetical protein O0L34_g2828 [Tuta absoluta]|nr:hypothetical protein O0L34_g2828 [Tuta absoluta]